MVLLEALVVVEAVQMDIMEVLDQVHPVKEIVEA
jgi:hypothetical protein